MDGKSNRRRGADYERQVVNYLRARGIPAERTSDGRQQTDGDLDGLPGVYLELKNCRTAHLAMWMDGAHHAAGDRLPVVVMRRAGTFDRGRDYCVIALADLLSVLGMPEQTMQPRVALPLSRDVCATDGCLSERLDASDYCQAHLRPGS